MCVSDLAVPDRLSDVVPSPQLTVTPVIVAELETVKEMVTVVPVLAGLGVGALTATVGGRTELWEGLQGGKGGSSQADQLGVEEVRESAYQQTQPWTSVH